MKLRILPLVALGVASLSGLVGCGKKAAADVTVGLICLHGSYSTYDNNFIIAMKDAQKKLGFKLAISEDIPEGPECYDEAKKLAQQGCDVIFADSFGHEQHMIKAAKEFPNTLFCHATGTNAASENLPNFGNAFASIYEGRYLAGVAGGLRMKADIEAGKYTAAEAKVGYVGAFTYAEIISGFTSFYLGVRSVVPEATMEVKYSGSWYDENAEKSIANELINDYNCKLISQHADSHGAPTACEAKNIPNVSYNGSTLSDGPNTYLINSRINWAPYYEHIINGFLESKKAGEAPKVENDWSEGFAAGSVEVDKASKTCPDGTQAKLDEVKKDLVDGKLHVFDLSKFTVGGEAPSSSNVMPDPANTYPTAPAADKLLANGYYHESEFRSAPSFDVIIDGIHNINTVF